MDLTVSKAYRAASAKGAPINKEPWLHVRLVNKVGTKDWFAVVYVWDTREVVQVVQLKPGQHDTVKEKWEIAVDNGSRLKDPKNMIPEFAKGRLTRAVVGE